MLSNTSLAAGMATLSGSAIRGLASLSGLATAYAPSGFTFVTGILEKHRSFGVLVKEVLAAQRYINQAKKWFEKNGCPEYKARVSELLSETEVFLEENFFSSDTFLSSLTDLEKLGNDALRKLAAAHGDKNKPLQQAIVAGLQSGIQTAYLRFDPAYYRQQLGFHMLRVIETLKEISMHKKLDGCDVSGGAGRRGPSASAASRERVGKTSHRDYITLKSGGILVQNKELEQFFKKMKHGSETDASSETFASSGSGGSVGHTRAFNASVIRNPSSMYGNSRKPRKHGSHQSRN